MKGSAQNVYLIRLGEAYLKGKNKPYFEKKIIDKVRAILGAGYRVKKLSGLILAEAEPASVVAESSRHLDALASVFGVATISPAVKHATERRGVGATCGRPHDVVRPEETITEIVRVISDELITTPVANFKVSSHRRDKTFPLKSPDIERAVGAGVLEKTSGKVDLKNPQKTFHIDIREDAFYVYSEIIPGAGGLPANTNGHGIALLSSGIDSPVATYLMAKRGMRITAAHFHSYPYTSDRAKDKLLRLAKILAEKIGPFKLHIMNLLPAQEEIRKSLPERELTIHVRRAMVRLAAMLRDELKAEALITGESLGQVASQTAESLACTDEAAHGLVLRPLIGNEKTEIIELARKIGTFETSIEPYEDCCTVFLPKRPVTRPSLAKILASEKTIDLAPLLEKIFAEKEVVSIEG